MSILLKKKIIKSIKTGDILVEPFIKKNVGPNSIDVTLSNKLVTYVPLKEFHSDGKIYLLVDKKKMKKMKTYSKKLKTVVISTSKKNKIFLYTIPKRGVVLTQGIMYLGSTNEKAGSSRYIPMYEGRSSKARLSLQSHISAGFGDIGFQSNWTLEIIVTHPLHIYPNERIGQVYFMDIKKKDFKKMSKKSLYDGKYNNQTGPQASKSHKDFK